MTDPVKFNDNVIANYIDVRYQPAWCEGHIKNPVYYSNILKYS